MDCFAALAMTAFLTGGERGMSVLKDAKNDEPPDALRAAGVRIQLPFRYFLLI